MAKATKTPQDFVTFVRDEQSESPYSKVNETKATSTSIWLTRKRNLFLASSVASLPLLVIAIILLVFVFQPDHRQKPAADLPDKSTYNLVFPAPQFFRSGVYWTDHHAGSFLLLASWASSMATLVTAPFMILYSYIIARKVVQESATGPQVEADRPEFFYEVLRGGPVGLILWGKYLILGKKRQILPQKAGRLGVINVAGFGLLTTCILTVLVVVGDNWLHATTKGVPFTYYGPIQGYYDSKPFNISDAWPYNPSVTLARDICDSYITNKSRLPCSINMTENGLVNLVNPEDVYPTLLSGISKQNDSLNTVNFTTKENDAQYTDFEIITFFQNESYHSIYFSASAAEEDPLEYGNNYAIDFVAQTYSMSTQCTIITNKCNLTALTNSSQKFDQNNIKIPFDCYNFYLGDLGQTPLNGHAKAQGWNTSFYSLDQGTPRNISVEEQLNPFQFYVTAAVNSITPDFYFYENTTGTDSHDLVAVDGGLTAFALNCSAAIYQVNYTLFNGSLHRFEPAIASPNIAAIIKAPLQVGFGSYHLYEQAEGAVLNYDPSSPQDFADAMANALSQTSMALASGAFDYAVEPYTDTKVRLRYTIFATAVPKAPFWFLVIASLLYSFISANLTLIAFLLRRLDDVKNEQARLMGSIAGEKPKKLDLGIDFGS